MMTTMMNGSSSSSSSNNDDKKMVIVVMMLMMTTTVTTTIIMTMTIIIIIDYCTSILKFVFPVTDLQYSGPCSLCVMPGRYPNGQWRNKAKPVRTGHPHRAVHGHSP